MPSFILLLLTYLSLYLKCNFSCLQYINWVLSVCQSQSFNGMFRPFIFNLISDMAGFKYTISLLVLHYFSIFSRVYSKTMIGCLQVILYYFMYKNRMVYLYLDFSFPAFMLLLHSFYTFM